MGRYFTGRACRKGHVAERLAHGACVECKKLHEANRRKDPKRIAAVKIANAKWRTTARGRMKSLENGRKFKGLPAPTRPSPDVCECCGKSQHEYFKALALDHCHSTGVFRGWLCNRCNLALGALGDSAEGVKRMVEYLERAGG